MSDENVWKKIVIIKSGLFEWNVMPFGLKNATNIFSCTTVKVFKGWINQFLKIFVDEINIHSSDWSDHLDHLRLVFDILRYVKLKFNPGKCCFETRDITFVGHVVNQQGSRLDPTKVHVISKFPTLMIIINVWTFLGLIGYYKAFIQGYAKIIGPLFDLTKKYLVFQWTLRC
jgi:hypothetical protein